VKITPAGIVLPDYPKAIPADSEQIYKSEDGEYWAFFKVYDGGDVSEVYCLFVPPGSI